MVGEEVNLSEQKDESLWGILIWTLDSVADAWVLTLSEMGNLFIKTVAVTWWLLVVLFSPVWIGPYLLYRKHKK